MIVSVPGHFFYIRTIMEFSSLGIIGQFFNIAFSLFGGIMPLQYNHTCSVVAKYLHLLWVEKECCSQVINA